MNDWPFADPKNVVTVTVRQIVKENMPILLVHHDIDDGGWQFLTGGEFNMADAMLVCLYNMTLHDPSLLELADLPLGWKATRSKIGEPWQCAENA